VLLPQVMLNVAKEAPSAFLPHLEALVGRIQQLWDAGQLREGEKVRPAAGYKYAVLQLKLLKLIRDGWGPCFVCCLRSSAVVWGQLVQQLREKEDVRPAVC
jgi:hypothetical protein